MRNLRIWFSKTGRAKYVSHLDLNRCMLRAFRRSGVPVWYTEGFNPHPYVTFALPLPLGAESINDVMDIKIDGEISDNEIVHRLNAVLPEGLRILRAAEPWGKPDEISLAKYEIYFDKESSDPGLLVELISRGEIICERMGKQSGRKVMKQINLAEHIREYSISENDGLYILYITLSAGSAANANPMLLADYITKESGGRLEIKNLRRTELLTRDGAEFI